LFDDHGTHLLAEGLRVIGAPAVELLRRWFEGAEDAVRKAGVTILLAEFGEGAAGCVPLLVAEVANTAKPKERLGVRCATGFALARIDLASAEVVAALTQVAGSAEEAQPLRSYCMEALMDLGPAAAAAIPMLEQVLKAEAEGEDLRNFAWSALKPSVQGRVSTRVVARWPSKCGPCTGLSGSPTRQHRTQRNAYDPVDAEVGHRRSLASWSCKSERQVGFGQRGSQVLVVQKRPGQRFPSVRL
jgi:hypothetical protein